jgi:hypothetical protein
MFVCSKSQFKASGDSIGYIWRSVLHRQVGAEHVNNGFTLVGWHCKAYTER